MRPLPRALHYSLLALALTAPTATAADDPKAALAAQARTVLQRYCQKCHNGSGSTSGYDFDVLNLKLADDRGASDKLIVAAGKSAESRLYVRASEKSMPPKSEKERPTDADLALLKQWIDASAPAIVPDKRRFIALGEILSVVRQHVSNAAEADQPYFRYFTLTHLYNNPEVPDAEMRLYRAALSKALNSLSSKANMVLPEPIDKEQTVFAIDIRRLDWDRGNLWSKIIAVYPYGLKYSNLTDRNLSKFEREICLMTKSDMPILRGDWFSVTATRPPLYYTLLRVPTNARKLEEQLGLNIADNFTKGTNIMRAGFTKSGVSNQNRLLERHESLVGANYYWKSYDFKPTNGRANLKRYPLGPLNLFPQGKHPYQNQAFVHDGGEIIWSLPNRMQAYMLIKGNDDRIDAGPIDVVSDGAKTSGTYEIVNGISCMYCHNHGMIGFTDRLREGSTIFGEGEEKVRRLYPEPKKMNEYVETDKTAFLGALEKCIGPYLRVDDASKKQPLVEFAEPISQIAQMYHRHMTLRTITTELYLEKPEDLRLGDKETKVLGLDEVMKGGYIDRQEWEALDGYSLMQQVAKVLRYTPFGP